MVNDRWWELDKKIIYFSYKTLAVLIGKTITSTNRKKTQLLKQYFIEDTSYDNVYTELLCLNSGKILQKQATSY